MHACMECTTGLNRYKISLAYLTLMENQTGFNSIVDFGARSRDWHGSSQHPVHGLSQSDSILDDAKQTQAQCGQDGSDVDGVRKKAKEFVEPPEVMFADCVIPISSHVRSLGVIIDSALTFSDPCYKIGQHVLLPAAADSICQEVLDDWLRTRHRSGSHTFQTWLLQQPVVWSS